MVSATERFDFTILDKNQSHKYFRYQAESSSMIPFRSISGQLSTTSTDDHWREEYLTGQGLSPRPDSDGLLGPEFVRVAKDQASAFVDLVCDIFLFDIP